MPESLTAEEQQRARNEARDELLVEHDRLMQEYEVRRARSKRRSTARHNSKKDERLAQVREEARLAFYDEHGYQCYVNSRGQELWLPAEEYEWRMRVRRQQKRRGNTKTKQQRMVFVYAIFVGIAVLAGLVLLQRSL